jgi:deoxyribodipyrimidine photo-lyase
MLINPRRIRALNEKEPAKGPIIYWMSRDQRVHDNWALVYALQLAKEVGSSPAVAFCLSPRFLGATCRQYHFMLEGMKEVEKSLKAFGIPFFLRLGDPGKEIPRLQEEMDAGALVCDFSPLRISRQWKNEMAEKIDVPFYEVDAHNIVPCWYASQKQEWAAYSFRPKVHRLLTEFLDDFPSLKAVDKNSISFRKAGHENSWPEAAQSIRADFLPGSFPAFPGEAAALRQLADFLEGRLIGYDTARNDPNKNGQSGLSPYIHFGQISAQRIALQVMRSGMGSESFLEELIVRRELSDNFCCYNLHYDDLQGFPDWAKKSLGEHERDRREYIYSLAELEGAKTHDDLWNAAQREMLLTGKMHGYLRMYWAKKILEWTQSPQTAMHAAVCLNDRYELDGRDPNGYTGIAWSLGGLHDRAWKERAIFGKVRYMSYKGAKGKFDVQAYINTWSTPEASPDLK